MINLRVQWPNPGHVLLAVPTIDLKIDDVPLSPILVLLGTQDFIIPDGVAKVELQIAFSADLAVVFRPTLENFIPPPSNVETFVVFQAGQIYRVDQNALVAETAIIVGKEALDLTRVVHPLIQTVSAANVLSGIAVVEMRTEFLDITEHWFKNQPVREETLFKNDTEPDGDFMALAATGANPPLWFVHFPLDMDPGVPDTSVVTFFRPHGHYTYSTAFDPRHAARGQQDLSRYLLAPQTHDPLDLGNGPERFEERFPFADTYYPLRIGWQQAVLRSGKDVVVIHPWPTSGLQFGDALTAKLPAVIDQILRYLHGSARISASQLNVQLGRLGVSGFSAGGQPAVQCMKVNRSRVKEMFLFDPFPFVPDIPFVVDWAFKTKDFRLRMTGANFWGQCETARRTIIAGLTGEAGDTFVTLKPTSPTFYKPEDKGGGHYWSYAMHTQPELLSAPHVQHQFAAFGGDLVDFDANFEMITNTTWLEEFFTNSAF